MGEDPDRGSRGRGERSLVPVAEALIAARDRLQTLRDELSWVSESPLLIAAPGSLHKTKIWPEARWSELLDRLYAPPNYPLSRSSGGKDNPPLPSSSINGEDKVFPRQILIGSMDDHALIERIAGGVAHPVANLAGKTGLAELIALISIAELFVGSDSGPMHLAAAVGTPVVAIFGPTVQEFGFSPYTDRKRVVENVGLICRPCHPHGPEKCPLGHFKCMLEIGPEDVMRGIAEVTGQMSHEGAKKS